MSIDGYLTRPDEAITKLGPIDDPLVGVFVHWTYAPHTVDGVVGKDNPLLLASNFSGTWPGLVALLNTGASLESVGRAASRIWTDAADWTADAAFMERLDEWCSTGRIRLPHQRAARRRRRLGPRRSRWRPRSKKASADRRVLALMLGDTSMGMINGYFGPRLLYPIGFSRAQGRPGLAHRSHQVRQRPARRRRFPVRPGPRRHVPLGGRPTPRTSPPRPPASSFAATWRSSTCSTNSRPTAWAGNTSSGCSSCFRPATSPRGCLNSHARPEGNGHVVITSTEADQGNLVPMELMKRLLEAKGLPGAVMFHDVRWGAAHDGRFLWVLLNSGSCGAYAFNHDVEVSGRHPQLPPAGRLLPRARRHVRRRQPAGPDHLGAKPGSTARASSSWTWAAASRSRLPDDVREAWWRGTTRQWPFMAADLGCSMETIMAHYMSNHIAVAYGDIFGEMAALSQSLGFKVRILSLTAKTACRPPAAPCRQLRPLRDSSRFRTGTGFSRGGSSARIRVFPRLNSFRRSPRENTGHGTHGDLPGRSRTGQPRLPACDQAAPSVRPVDRRLARLDRDPRWLCRSR